MDKSNDEIPRTEWALAARLAAEGDRVRRRNARFARLTPEKQRVAIAKDVITLLDAEKISAGYVGYCTPSLDTDVGVVTDACTVCALGGLFVAATLLGDTSTTEHDLHNCTHYSADVYGALKPTFSGAQLQLIETAYEGMYVTGTALTTAQVDEARAFGSQYTDKAARLRAIMHNIIRNGGEFMP